MPSTRAEKMRHMQMEIYQLQQLAADRKADLVEKDKDLEFVNGILAKTVKQLRRAEKSIRK
jgi:hypothetical protein